MSTVVFAGASMRNHLPNHPKALIEQQVASGHYEDESQVIEDAPARFAGGVEPGLGPTMAVAQAVSEPTPG